jgi:hypothetical protein
MNAARLDKLGRIFARRRLSRRAALSQAGAGLVAVGLAATGLKEAHAKGDTPDATFPTDDYEKIPYLFVQSFESGTIASKEGEDGAYTITLAHGLGQTLYFSDRPLWDVGATPTDRFLTGLGFPDDNPPNAALLVDDGAGWTEIAVVELRNPVFDPAGPGVTYDLTVLAG